MMKQTSPQNPVLILAPTSFELEKLRRKIAQDVLDLNVVMATCGFGLVASAIQSTLLVARWNPRLVILTGIAGAMHRDIRMGSAHVFSKVACYGIGAGSGLEFQTFEQLGWREWNSVGGSTFGDVIFLNDDGGPMLLSVCSASASPSDVQARLTTFPDAFAEDMESYSVAMACRSVNVPLTVVRGISNLSGDRDKSRWNIDAAVESVARWITPDKLT